MKKISFAIILLSLLFVINGCTNKKYTEVAQSDSTTILADNIPAMDENSVSSQDTVKVVKIDDWELTQNYLSEERRVASIGGQSGKGLGAYTSVEASIVSRESSIAYDATGSVRNSSSNDALGLAVGGAKDINNFRENIENGYMPLEEDITHEGIFYDYFFDNNITKEAKHLFEPTFTSYKNNHPLTENEELYLSVGLNSNLTKSSFERKKLNLTIVLDISGSMSSEFDRYYYDNGMRKERDSENFDNRTKMEIAKECIIDLTKHLKDEDRFAVVLYDHASYIAKPFNLIGNTDMDAIRQHINEINASGGTNMYEGIKSATELYAKLPKYDSREYDNRIIFLTDAMPNTNITDENTLWGMMKTNSERKIYTSFIGIGIDLNSELINYITKTPGANYYSVHNAKEFKKRMDTQFDFMVTPLVFDLTLHLKSDSYEIEEVYGSPEADKATGEIMRVNTLFPSETEDGQTRGGIILIKLKRISQGKDIQLTCSYKDRNGVPELVKEDIVFSNSTRGSDNGIRKAVLLSRYVNLMHDWINDDLDENNGENEGQDDWQYNNSQSKPRHIRKPRSKWERMSRKLNVSPIYKKKFSAFKEHFAKEATAMEDEDLRQELDILDLLTK